MSIYNGNSVGFKKVTDGYIDYAEEIIARRAIPDLRDGLKPVNRRIIYSSYFSSKKKDYMQSCSVVVSDAMDYHPHGDASIYNSFALLTDKNGSNAIPMFKGQGNFGNVFSSDGPAAMRYTECMCHENMSIYFQDGKREHMHMVPGEKNNLEPETLNAIIPIVLINNSSGIAVAVGTNVPSFNITDVLDLTSKYLREGNLSVQSDIIAPDFQTGGILVRNDTELAKIMEVGKGKVKIRAKVEIEGKDILVKEVPYGATVESIVKKIESSDIKEIQKAGNIVGRGSKALVKITCKTKKSVEYVLMELYRRNILQTNFSSNILVLDAGTPKILGVFGVIKEWCKWRESVIVEKYQRELNAINEELPSLEILMDLIKDKKACENYALISIREGRKKAREYFSTVLENHGYSDINSDTASWLAKECKNVDTLHDGDKFAKRYNDLLIWKEQVERYISSPKDKILEDIEQERKRLAPFSERKTELTHKDYKFSKISDSESIEDTSYCVWTLKMDGFLRKTRIYEDTEDVLCQFSGQANDILIGFDNYGEVVRVVGSEIPFTASGDMGVYLPKYFDRNITDDYKVLYLGQLDGKMRMLVYRDGYVGFFDTSEFVGKKNIKVIVKGVPLKVMDKLLDVIEEDDIPEYLMVAGDDNGVIRIGIKKVENIPIRSRHSCANVFGTGNDRNIKYLRGFNNYFEIMEFIDQPDIYMGQFKKLSTNINGEPTTLADGKYLEICTDLEES